MEQETLQTQQLKKRKLPKWLIALIVTPLVIIAIHFHFYPALKKEFHADQSVNPEATSYFLHASTVYIVWIGLPHEFLSIDYDSPLLKPFLLLRDYLFEKGEASMPPDNAEDAMWWLQNYGRMYGFSVEMRKDESMVIETLDKPTQRAIREKMYTYIIKLDKYGIKGVKSEKLAHSPAILMTYLIQGYCNNIEKMYDGDSNDQQFENFYTDTNTFSKLIKIYSAYDNSLKKYSFTNIDRPSEYNKQHLLGMTIWSLIYNVNIPKILCDSPELTEYLRLTSSLYSWASHPEQIKDDDLQRIAHAFMKESPRIPQKLPSAIIEAVSNECKLNDLNRNLIKTIQGVNNGR
ncbi:hypothetical protein [Sulfuricurvum sp.]|uniref:hypothetical protein n=1 Tax=Sulfuricurvum sp. TaxID=2025608 RepID=UPI0026359FC4|nr:hypothetical protein [Sulfuricurvum sp.]MDD2780861.1 hypothetical protein [Sulfuricurvum sp.]